MISDELQDYLGKWYHTSMDKKAKQGVLVELTLEQFVGLLGTRRIQSLQMALDAGRLTSQMHSENQFAFVASWRDYAARSSNVYNLDTAIICTRVESKARCMPKKGDTLRPQHREKLSKRLSGRKLSETHRENISKGRCGQKGRIWTDEQRKAASKRAKVREAAKRGERK